MSDEAGSNDAGSNEAGGFDETASAEGAVPVDRGASDRGPSKRGVGASSLVGLLMGGAATYFVIRTLVDEWSEASERIRDANYNWLVAALVLAALGMATIGWCWGRVLRVLGVRVPSGRVTAWYFVGELGKYLPGGVWPVLGRGELARRGGVPRTRAYASVAMSLGVLYLAAMFVGAALLPFAISGGGFSPWMLLLAALPVGLVLLHHDVLDWLLRRVSRLTKREIDVDIPVWRDSLMLVARYVPSWLFIGTATWAVARALTPDAPFTRVVFAAVLSWIAGFLAVPVPAGAGIREAVLLAASGLDGGVAATTAIVARVIFIAVDLGGAALGAPVAGRRRGGVRVGPIPTGGVDPESEVGREPVVDLDPEPDDRTSTG